MIIGLTGPMGCGKSTVAKRRGRNNGCRIVSFAEPLKEMIGVVLGHFGYGGSLVHTQEGKATHIPELGCTIRHILQTLGPEWGRNCIHPDLWVIIAMERAKRHNRPIIFDDVRFENEAQGIRDAGGEVIHITGRGDTSSDHQSEQGVKLLVGDVVIDNSTTPCALNYQVQVLVERLGL